MLAVAVDRGRCQTAAMRQIPIAVALGAAALSLGGCGTGDLTSPVEAPSGRDLDVTFPEREVAALKEGDPVLLRLARKRDRPVGIVNGFEELSGGEVRVELEITHRGLSALGDSGNKLGGELAGEGGPLWATAGPGRQVVLRPSRADGAVRLVAD